MNRCLHSGLKTLLLLLVLLIGEAQKGKAQLAQPYHEIWSTKNNKAPDRSFHQMYFDTKGVGWFASTNNLYKFFEGEFQRTKLGRWTANNVVFRICEGSPYRVWFMNQLNELFYYEGDTIQPFAHNDSIAKYVPIGQFINSLKADGDVLYMGFRRQALLSINIHNGKVTHLKELVPQPLDTATGHVFIKELENSIVLGQCFLPRKVDKTPRYRFRIHRFDDNNNWTRTDTLTFPKAPKGNDNQFRGVKLENNILAISKGNTLALLNEDGVLDHQLFDANIVGLATDDRNNLWVALQSGGVHVFANGDMHQAPQVYFKEFYHPLKEQIQDHEGGYWLSGTDAKIVYVPYLDMLTYGNPEAASQINSLAIAKDQHDNIYYGDRALGLVKIHANRNDSSRWSVPAIHNESPHLNALYFDTLRNELWVTTNYSTLVFDAHGTIINHLPGGLVSTSMNDSLMWIGGHHQLHLIHKNTKAVQRQYNSFNRLHRMDCFGDTLFIVDGDSVLQLIDGEVLPVVLPHNSSLAYTVFVEADSKTFLLMLGEEGLFKYHRGQFIEQEVSAPHLLKQVKTRVMMHDGYLWVMSFKGMLRINTTTTPYEIEQFAIPNNFRDAKVGSWVMSRDTLYCSSGRGFIALPMAAVTRQFEEFPIWIYDVKITQRDTQLQSFYELPYDQNQVAITYGTPTFKVDRKVTYRYKMEGVNNDWITTTKTDIQYTTLPPGTYTFTVQSKNWTGEWSKNQQVITFVILPPFWHTWWFYALEVLLGLLLGYLIVRIWGNRVRRKEQEKALMQQQLAAKEMEALKGQLTALQAQMNPHFIFNSLIAIQSYIYKQNTREAGDYLSRFAKLMRQILENSGAEAVTLSTEENMLENYLELQKLRFSNRFDYAFEIDEKLDPEAVLIPPFLAQPFIENAIEHGLMPLEEQGRLTIRFQQQGDRLLFVLEDNGIGIQEATKQRTSTYQPMAIEITRKRLNLLNRDTQHDIVFRIENKADQQGTKVTFTIPLKLQQ